MSIDTVIAIGNGIGINVTSWVIFESNTIDEGFFKAKAKRKMLK